MPDSGHKPQPQPLETIQVEAQADEVCCDGGGGTLGHPRVWYSFDGRNSTRCQYCDRVFVKKAANS